MPEGRPIAVVADDLGLRPDWDRAIFDAIDRGFVSAVSVVADGPTFNDALLQLTTRPAIHVGVHLVIPRADYRGQIARVRDRGLTPAFVNGHHHLHMLPGAFKRVVNAAQAHGIIWVRVPDEPLHYTLQIPTRRAFRLFKVTGLEALAIPARRLLRSRGLPDPLVCRGVAAGERFGITEWRQFLAEPGSEPMEIVCHPGQSPTIDEALQSNELLDELRQRALPFSFRA